MAVEIQEPRAVMGLDLREMTFQNVVDSILRPSGIKIGGFPEELFLNLTEQEHHDMMCNICFLIANDCRLCDNDHVFCHSCIIAWSMTFGENAHRCPVCRCDQVEYSENDELQKLVDSKQVRCLVEGCCFQSTLADYLLHEHGEAAYSNAHVDFSCFTQPLIRPLSAADSSSLPVLSTSVRSQLLQSRTMIQQMMMLMRIEMQLRQQAMLHFHQSQDADSDHAPGLDDALALNSQLSEISSVLATLIRLTSAGHRSGGQRWPTHRSLPGLQRLRRADTSGFARSAALRRLSNLSPRLWRDTDSTVNDDSGVTDDTENDSTDDDDYDTTSVNNAAPANDIVDNFIWHQLTESRATVNNVMRSSPDGMSAFSPVSDIQSVASVDAAVGLPSATSVSRASSERSLSSAANVAPYSPSLSGSVSYEGQSAPPRYVVCVNSYELATPGGHCSCQVCSAFDHVTVGDDDDDDDVLLRDHQEEGLLGGSHHDIHLEPSSTSDVVSEARQWQQDVSSPSSSHRDHGAVANSSHSCEFAMSCPTHVTSRVEPVHRTQQQHHDRSLQASQTSLPAVDRQPNRQSAVNTSLLLPPPGARQSPLLNYAARLRRQASDVTHLPSEVTIRPWPFPDSAASNRLPSLSVSGVATRRVGPSSRSSIRPLLTYALPPHQSSATTAARQSAASSRGRTTRSSRYNTAVSGDHTYIPRL